MSSNIFPPSWRARRHRTEAARVVPGSTENRADEGVSKTAADYSTAIFVPTTTLAWMPVRAGRDAPGENSRSKTVSAIRNHGVRMTRTAPALRLEILLSRRRAATLVLYRLAMLTKVSPDLTLWCSKRPPSDACKLLTFLYLG